MFKRKHRRERGLSLLEILLAIILLAMVIMATATVYPGGYKLNATNKLTSQATTIAQGILEEIKMRPFAELECGNVSPYENFSIQEMAMRYNKIIDMCTEYRWPFHNDAFTLAQWKENSPVLSWATRTNLTDMVTLLRDEKKTFFLPEYGSIPGVPPGIVVRGYGDGDQTYSGTDWIPHSVFHEPPMAHVQITVAWIEYRNKTPIAKHVTISSWLTENKNE